MVKKERIEISKVFDDLIDYLELNLEYPVFLCPLQKNIGKRDVVDNLIQCGYNHRIIPLAIEYLIDQKPTAVKNKDYYNTVCYNKGSDLKDSWWQYTSYPNITVNMEKIRFLKHLKRKLNR